MFDFGFTELMVIGVVALIVVGPERLPRVARTAGHLLGRVQRYVSTVKGDIQREMQLEDLKKLQTQVETQARDFEASMRGHMQKVESEVAQTGSEVREALRTDTAGSGAQGGAGPDAVTPAQASSAPEAPAPSASTASPPPETASPPPPATPSDTRRSIGAGDATADGSKT